jgi:hypothetical protein
VTTLCDQYVFINKFKWYWIWNDRSVTVKSILFYFLGCDAVLSVSSPKFRWNILLPSSRSKSKLSKRPAVKNQSSVSTRLHGVTSLNIVLFVVSTVTCVKLCAEHVAWEVGVFGLVLRHNMEALFSSQSSYCDSILRGFSYVLSEWKFTKQAALVSRTYRIWLYVQSNT